MALAYDVRLDLGQAGVAGRMARPPEFWPISGQAMGLFALLVATDIKRLARVGIGGGQDLGLFLFRLFGFLVTFVLFLGHGDAPA